jgi:hypothetical protein
LGFVSDSAAEIAIVKLRSKAGKRHLFIPDLQIKPGVPLNHLHWIAMYAMDKEVDQVVFGGDGYDMHSLSTHDKRGGKRAEGRRVVADLTAGDRGVEIFGETWGRRGFDPDVDVTLGNHEDRVKRAIEENPHLLDGVCLDFAYESFGWKVHPFLKPVMIDGIRYCHFFPHNAKGNITQTRNGAPSALEQARRQMCSATAGHQQGLDVAIIPTEAGLRRGLIAGSCYLHDEDYMPTNNYWRGVLLKTDVRGGDYNLVEVDLHWLHRRYGKLEPPGRKVA